MKMIKKILVIFFLSLFPMLTWSQGKVTMPKKPVPMGNETNPTKQKKKKSPPKETKIGVLLFKIIDEKNLVVQLVNGKEGKGKITIPSTINILNKSYAVTSIDQFAFFSCRGLTGISIPNSIRTIGKDAFFPI